MGANQNSSRNLAYIPKSTQIHNTRNQAALKPARLHLPCHGVILRAKKKSEPAEMSTLGGTAVQISDRTHPTQWKWPCAGTKTGQGGTNSLADGSNDEIAKHGGRTGTLPGRSSAELRHERRRRTERPEP
jgi:hypothetical protein